MDLQFKLRGEVKLTQQYPKLEYCPEKERMVAILECIGDGVISTDLYGTIEYINTSAEELTGWTVGDAVGRKFEEVFSIINIDTEKTIENPIKEALKTGSSVGLKKQTVLISKDGSKKYISANCSPIKNGNADITGSVVVFRDITRLIKMEIDLTTERNNLKTNFENNPMGTLIIDENMNIKQVNKSFLKMFNQHIDNVIGKKIGAILPCINADSEKECGKREGCKFCEVRNTIKEVLGNRTPRNGLIIKHTLIVNDKEINPWYKINFAPIIVGDMVQIMLVIDDITEIKKDEELITHAKEDAETANKGKSEFLANMSHEIRTPLNGIVAMIEITLLTDLRHDQRENLMTAKTCVNSLLTVINDILDFSKMEAGKLVIENINFDIKELIEEIIKVHSPRAVDKGLKLNYAFPAAIPQYFIGDPSRLKQVLHNLVSNALKFTERGRVWVTVKKVEALDEYIKLKFSVSDTGIGIEKDNMDKLFKSFSQVDGSFTRKFGGTGLGLAISKQLTEIMGGQLWVESVEKVGSVFHFTLRFKIGEKIKEKHIQMPEVSKNVKSLKILLVEDDKVNQMVTVRILKERGYIVDIANDGREAVEMYKIGQYDIILMDIQMPEMDGIEATRRIRELEGSNKRTPIVALTAYALLGDRERFIEKGMDEYVSKPIKIDNLFYVIERVTSSNIVVKDDDNIGIRINENGEIEFFSKEKKGLSSKELSSLEELSKVMENLNDVLGCKEVQAIEQVANSIKIISNSIGIDEIKSIAFKAELAARRGNLNEAVEYALKIQNEYETLKKSVDL